MKQKDVVSFEERLQSLERALDLAIERARSAKQAAKQAKDEAKVAKKERKRARRALVEAQEEFAARQQSTASESIASEVSDSALNERFVGDQIAGSPERPRAPKVKKKPMTRHAPAVKKARSNGEMPARTQDTQSPATGSLPTSAAKAVDGT